MRRRAIPPLALAGLLVPAGLAAQSSASTATPLVLERLEGCWDGSGTLLGRAGRFRMSWAVESGSGFAHLAFRNGWVGEAGAVEPVLTARAVYQPAGDGLVGVWMDDRPERLRLEATLTDSSVVTRWRGDTEEGRTEYVVEAPDGVRVQDVVVVEGEARVFAEARYRRMTPGAGRTCMGAADP